MDLVPYPRKPH